MKGHKTTDKLSEKKHWYNNTWLQLAIGYLLLSPIGSAIYEHTKNVPILTKFILQPTNFLWQEILQLLIFKTSLWVVFLSLIMYYLAKRLVTKFTNQTVHSSPEPKYFSYKKDILKKWKWEWDYKATASGYTMVNLRPICNKDETPLIRNYPRGYICPRCETHYGDYFYEGAYNNEEDSDTIRVLIEDNIKKQFNNQ